MVCVLLNKMVRRKLYIGGRRVFLSLSIYNYIHNISQQELSPYILRISGVTFEHSKVLIEAYFLQARHWKHQLYM